MTLAAIAKTLAKELSTSDQNVEQVMRLLDTGLKAPTIAHYRRDQIGELTEGAIRRIERRRRQLEELDRRRRSLLRSVAKEIRAAHRADMEEAKAAGLVTEDAARAEQEQAQADPTPDGDQTSGDASAEASAGSNAEATPPVAEPEATAESADSADAAPAKTEAPAASATPPAPLDPVEEFSEISATLVKAAFRCTERSELEDLFLPLRRPEPEVQLAVDRGLMGLADLLVKPGPRTTGPKQNEASEPVQEPHSDPVAESQEPSPHSAGAAEVGGEAGALEAPGDESVSTGSVATATVEVASEASSLVASATAESTAESTADPAADPVADEAQPDAPAHDEPGGEATPPSAASAPKPAPVEAAKRQVEFTAELARLCAPFINTDRGVHTDEEALEGAMRILSDRLGRDPKVRGMLRRMVRKNARVTVRALVDEKQLGRNRSLLKLKVPLRQLQGHKLISLRQAQMRRQVSVGVELDSALALPRLVEALGSRIPEERHGVAEIVAERALHRRLLPMIEEDLRSEIRERAEEEAIRSIAQNLRQTLLAPPGGKRACAGVNIDAKGDWTIVALNAEGAASGEASKIEASSLELPQVAEGLRTALPDQDVRVLTVSSEKSAKEGTKKLRDTVHLLGGGVAVVPVNDAGLSGWANGEAARTEFGELSVPARTAVGLARRWQDPMRELVRVEARQLGLGLEQGIVGRGALRRLIGDTLESCIAFVGCELNTDPLHLLRHVPGIDFEVAQKIVARRAERPFTSLRELVDEGLLDEHRFRNAGGFLRIAEAPNLLERTTLHPEQYELAGSIVERLGVSLEEAVGNRDLLRGLKRTGFEIEEATWRDLVRALGSPGRDPRPRALIPRMLTPDTTPESLAKDQVVEGVIASVASFGAFVDLGIARDGMIHISEASQRYVRDARALLSVGQVVRARITNPESPRIELSLKGVPDPRRAGGARGRGGPGGHGGGRGAGGHKGRGGRDKEQWSESQAPVRAARSRRDGLAGAAGGAKGRGRGGPGGGRGFGGGRRGAGGRRDEEGFDRDAVRRAASEKISYNPFANFFQKKDGDKEDEE